MSTWKIQPLGHRPGYPTWQQFAIRDAATNVHIATVGDVDRYFEGKTEEHARLIAAAPDLFEALNRIANDPDTPWRFSSIARQAIAKATGGAK